MPSLNREHRRLLENTVAQARAIAVAGAEQALLYLGVHEPKGRAENEPLREQLRAHGKHLGDQRHSSGAQGTARLIQACAYEHWHRMLFARFLAENDLLLDADHGMAMTLDEVQELAREQGRDWLEIAAELAQKMLLAVFRPDDPVLRVSLPPETRQQLEEKLAALPAEVFKADDSLGWVYQFWQRDEKDRVNKAEVKIGADELPAVTQLLTEDYMVLFLLENTLGAWWTAKRRSEGKNPALPGYEWTYLRLNDDGSPTAGSFDGWPRTARELRVLDPSMGSGHFLVFALPILARMRMEEEGLSLKEALAAVLEENLFGLEIDARCAQIAAFNLALAVWRLAGEHVPLPQLNLACSGLGINASEEDWARLGQNDFAADRWMRRLYSLFRLAPTLGSLIDPTRFMEKGEEAGLERVLPLIEEALSQEQSDEKRELAIAAQGVLAAFRILASRFTLVATNVPYLGRGKQDAVLARHCEEFHSDAKSELATCFIDRCLRFCRKGGSVATVTPQNWLIQTSHERMRRRLLAEVRWNFLIKLGPGAFEAIGGEVVSVALVGLSAYHPDEDQVTASLDVSNQPDRVTKSEAFRSNALLHLKQADQLSNPDARIIFDGASARTRLNLYADSVLGLGTCDAPHYVRCFWEHPRLAPFWQYMQSAPNDSGGLQGKEHIVAWDPTTKRVHGMTDEERQQGHNQDYRGRAAWTKRGIAVSLTGTLRISPYSGDLFDKSLAVLVPKDPAHLQAIWEFCNSQDFVREVRNLDQRFMVTNATLIKVPFDLDAWSVTGGDWDQIESRGNCDPTQWTFDGAPRGSRYPLQVVIARLVGFRWPHSIDARDDMEHVDVIDNHEDADGIVCLSSIAGEASAGERVRSLLADAFGSEWSASKLTGLLNGTDSLEVWLRDEFFEEHCRVFHDRPFVWHIWDGRKDGFHALVNYHRLAGPDGEGRKTLEKLIYTYLGRWIERQNEEIRSGKEGADARLAAALHLKTELEKILAGEKPYDLFVRWKPLHEQPIGWEPDINDGVRLNIRPWLATTLAPSTKPKKGACILRVTPKINYGKDRGKEPHRPMEDFPWFWSWDEQSDDFLDGRAFDGARWNDLHYSLEVKRKARARKAQEA